MCITRLGLKQEPPLAGRASTLFTSHGPSPCLVNLHSVSDFLTLYGHGMGWVSRGKRTGSGAFPGFPGIGRPFCVKPSVFGQSAGGPGGAGAGGEPLPAHPGGQHHSGGGVASGWSGVFLRCVGEGALKSRRGFWLL